MAEHSKGPWAVWADHAEVFAGDIRGNTPGNISGGYRIAMCDPDEIPVEGESEMESDEIEFIADETAKANARLIAAAPELLAALKGLLDGIEQTPCSCHKAYTGRGLTDPGCTRCGMDLTSDELDAAHNAIAKATS